MSRNGAGVYSPPANSWNPAVVGTVISATDFAALLADLSAAISASIAVDGQSTTTASIPVAAGIKFPAAVNAQADVNTLDDYEEGSFTPALTFGGAAVGMTFGLQSGKYTKIGNRVHFVASIVLTAKGSSTGTALLTALPFTSAAGAGNNAACAGYVDATSAVTVLQSLVLVSSTTVGLYNFAGNASAALTDVNFTNTTTLSVTGTYESA